MTLSSPPELLPQSLTGGRPRAGRLPDVETAMLVKVQKSNKVCRDLQAGSEEANPL